MRSEFTCVSSTHVHVADQPPRVALRVEHFHALPHQRTVVSSCGVQQAAQNAHTCTTLIRLFI